MFTNEELQELEEIAQLLGSKQTFMLGVNIIKSKKYIESYTIIQTIASEDGNMYLIECILNSKFSESENVYFINTLRNIRTKLNVSFAMGGLMLPNRNSFRMAR